MQNWCEREGRPPETQTASTTEENLSGDPRPVLHRHLQEKQRCARVMPLPSEGHSTAACWKCPFVMKLVFCAFLRLQMVMQIPKYFPISFFSDV